MNLISHIKLSSAIQFPTEPAKTTRIEERSSKTIHGQRMIGTKLHNQGIPDQITKHARYGLNIEI